MRRLAVSSAALAADLVQTASKEPAFGCVVGQLQRLPVLCRRPLGQGVVAPPAETGQRSAPSGHPVPPPTPKDRPPPQVRQSTMADHALRHLIR